MTLRWRITITTALLIALASTVIGVASYLNISQAQMASIDSSLQSALGPNLRRLLEGEPQRRNPQGSFFTPVAIGVIDASGNVSTVRPAGTAEAPEPFPTLPTGEIRLDSNQDSQTITFVDESIGDSYRLFTRPAGRDFLAVAVTSLADYRTTMNQILINVISFVIGVTLLGAITTWLILRRFFAPVDSMIATAGAIAHGDFSQRVPKAQEGTELGDLSNSLNTMISVLTDSITRVESSEQSLRVFISDASHEIRTPLTVIRGYVEILAKDTGIVSEQDARAIARIDSESKRLERLVTRLLELDTYQMEATSEQIIRLDEIILLHFNDLESISQRPITYDLDPVTIRGNSSAWEQLVSNITQNISRYTPAQSAVGVELRTIVVGTDDCVEFVVNDCGPGIPLDKRSEVFTRFFRLDASRSVQTGGFGLGLSIVKAVVDTHSGTIALDQSPCGGLQIRIQVPRHLI